MNRRNFFLLWIAGSLFGIERTIHQNHAIHLTVSKAFVNARKLDASWTFEVAQDLKAIHGLDSETELANILSSEIYRYI